MLASAVYAVSALQSLYLRRLRSSREFYQNVET